MRAARDEGDEGDEDRRGRRGQHHGGGRTETGRYKAQRRERTEPHSLTLFTSPLQEDKLLQEIKTNELMMLPLRSADQEKMVSQQTVAMMRQQGDDGGREVEERKRG